MKKTEKSMSLFPFFQKKPCDLTKTIYHMKTTFIVLISKCVFKNASIFFYIYFIVFYISEYSYLFVVYKLRCTERRMYISMRKCIRTYGGFDHCFPRLYARGLIGRRHKYKRYGHGFGLGVKFVRKGIIYENSCE